MQATLQAQQVSALQQDPRTNIITWTFLDSQGQPVSDLVSSPNALYTMKWDVSLAPDLRIYIMTHPGTEQAVSFSALLGGEQMKQQIFESLTPTEVSTGVFSRQSAPRSVPSTLTGGPRALEASVGGGWQNLNIPLSIQVSVPGGMPQQTGRITGIQVFDPAAEEWKLAPVQLVQGQSLFVWVAGENLLDSQQTMRYRGFLGKPDVGMEPFQSELVNVLENMDFNIFVNFGTVSQVGTYSLDVLLEAGNANPVTVDSRSGVSVASVSSGQGQPSPVPPPPDAAPTAPDGGSSQLMGAMMPLLGLGLLGSVIGSMSDMGKA